MPMNLHPWPSEHLCGQQAVEKHRCCTTQMTFFVCVLLQVIEAGANALVAGSAVFGASDYKEGMSMWLAELCKFMCKSTVMC